MGKVQLPTLTEDILSWLVPSSYSLLGKGLMLDGSSQSFRAILHSATIKLANPAVL